MTSIATFNVRGMTEEAKRIHLANDMDKYNVNIMCLQETKVKDETRYEVNGKEFLFLKSESQHYGNGFVLDKKWKQSLHAVWRVSDRIAVIQLAVKEKYRCEKITDTKVRIKKCERPATLMNIINVYGPQAGRLQQSLEELDELYKDLNETMDKLRNKEDITIIAGDMNAIVGKTQNYACTGSFARGRTNSSGTALLAFCESREVFITNTAFDHKAAHTTTWEGSRNGTRLFSQIDYIICPKWMKKSLVDSRSYAGTQTYSDHRLVITKFDQTVFNRKRWKPQRKTTNWDVTKLVSNKHLRDEYRNRLDQELTKRKTKSWHETKEAMIKTAKETIPRDRLPKNQTFDYKVNELSIIQKDLRLKRTNATSDERKQELKRERNKIMKQIRQRLTEIENEKVEKWANEIENAANSMKMFKAVKSLNSKRVNKIEVNDEHGKRIANPAKCHDYLKQYFEGNFKSQNQPVPNITKAPLQKPITSEEVKKTINKMGNGKAAGKDQINIELIKYGTQTLYEETARALNEIFENGLDHGIGEGLLVPIQKPGKARGPAKNYRPVILLTTLRKILSNIFVERTANETEKYISKTQSAYRPGRSTTDNIWTLRWMIAKTQKFKIDFFLTGIDMSRAFDTIDRMKLLKKYDEIIGQDETRIATSLLTNTKLEVKIPNFNEPEQFVTNVGSPQGDGSSGHHFNVYQEEPVREVIETVEEHVDHIYCMTPPVEMKYADDIEFVSMNESKRDEITANVKQIFSKHNLIVNEEKTENLWIKREERKSETWRNSKKLGSLLGDQEDIIVRKNLASAALAKLMTLWKNGRRISLARKMLLYNALVKSILLYNSETWGMTKSEKKSINSFHRRQLRTVCNINYPSKITNNDLYSKCNAEQISTEIAERRWRYFGHVLRMNPETPCWKAMIWYFENRGLKTFRGRPRTTIVTTITDDIKQLTENNPVFCRNLGLGCLRTSDDLCIYRQIAQNRQRWKTVVNSIRITAKAENP
jgi:sorting nexin-29